MRTSGAWMLAVAVAAILLYGCEDQNRQVAMESAPPQPAAPPPYPVDAGAVHADPAPPPAESAAMAPADEPLPEPEPVDTAFEPAPQRSTARSTARQAPKENYARPKATVRTYKVKRGDTLQKISMKFYNTTRNWRRIYNYNRKTIGSDPDKLQEGVTLTIP